jgi:CubicO group peptidase (beta-lactamase class C family)
MLCTPLFSRFTAVALLSLVNACGGGGSAAAPAPSPVATSNPTPSPSPPANPWVAVDAAINAAAVQFPSGVTVEVATTQGVVYSKQVGAYSSDTFGEIASASKWVTGTVLLRLVDQGALSLDTKTKDLLTTNGQAWSGNLGEATLRDLLSFQTGIPSDLDAANTTTSLQAAVDAIYAARSATAQPPGTYFAYGNSHMRIAARMAEVRTGKPWAQIFNEQLRDPLGWSANTAYTFSAPINNPNPAGGLVTTGKEYMRFLVMQLRKGLDGNTRLLPAALIDEQRKEQWRAGTVIFFSPYTSMGKSYHYGLGLWRECDTPSAAPACDAKLRVSSTGAFGFAPWIDVQGNYAAAVMTRQPGQTGNGDFKPSEDLKAALAPLIPAALAQNPPVIRPVP